MNNKASKRLLAASVASLMLVVAFCGFTYASDDADADGTGSATDPYVKKVVVAVEAANGISDEAVSFKIVTTQNTIAAGTGIQHVDSWYKYTLDGSDNVVCDRNTDGLSENSADPTKFGTNFSMYVDSVGNVHTFNVRGLSSVTNAPVSVGLLYELSSTAGGQIISQQIYYRIDVTVVSALPSSGTSTTLSGYVGVAFISNVGSGGWLNFTPVGTNLMFYAEGLPEGLSMNIDGTISGVPTSEYDGTTTVSVYNGTSYVSTHTIAWDVDNNIAGLSGITVSSYDAIISEGSRYLVKEGSTFTISGTVDGYRGGTLVINDLNQITNDVVTVGASDGKFTSNEITISGTGEVELTVVYTFDLDGSGETFNVVLTHYITVVSVDVVEDATTGMGLVAGSP